MITRCWISVGSNVDAERHVTMAIAALETRYGEVVSSAIYQTPAAGFEGDDFLNLVLGIDTVEAPEAIMAHLRDIEAASGRVRGGPKFSARTLDLDLLTYGQHVGATPALPREDILEYDFVLGPLAEVAGDERHPKLMQTYRELWDTMRMRTGPLQRFVPPAGRSDR